MAVTYTISLPVSGHFTTTQLNSEFTKIQTALQDCLSRSGGAPNTMSADLDLNSNDILNVNNAQFTSITLGGTTLNTSHINGGTVPVQTGHAGKFLTTDGSLSSWGTQISVTWDVVTGGGISFEDNTSASFGTGDDLFIKHDGIDSRITHGGGSGDLIIENLDTSSNIRIKKDDSGAVLRDSIVVGGTGAEAHFYYGGVSVADVVSDGLDATNLYVGGTNISSIYEAAFSKNTAFNKNFGTSAGEVAEGNHAHDFASITSKPTTLSGYGITDAASDTELDNAHDLTITDTASTARDFILTDRKSFLRFTAGTAVSATVQPDSTTDFPIGSVLQGTQAGAGALTLVAGSGVTINTEVGLVANAQHAPFALLKTAANTWLAMGSLKA